MKKLIAMLAALSLFLLSACSGGGSGNNNGGDTSSGGGNLVVYTASNEEILSTLIPMFEEQTGIKVEVLTGGAGEMLKRIESESENPYCDVMLGGTKTVYMSYLDQFQEYVSVNDSEMLEGFGNYQGVLTPINLDSSVIMWNTNLIGDLEVHSYEQLLNPELKGKISYADPNSSGNALMTLVDMLCLYGDGDFESDAGWDMITRFVDQLEGKIASSSGNAHKSVADGENTITVTYEGAAFAYLKNEADVAIAYQSEGVYFSSAMSGIVNNCNNLENAKLFIDFITSKEVQDLFGTELMSRPVRADAALADFIPAMDSINTYDRDDEAVSAASSSIIERYNEIYAELQ